MKTFAFFDIEASLCKQQYHYQNAAAEAFCLPKETKILSAFAGSTIPLTNAQQHQEEDQQQQQLRHQVNSQQMQQYQCAFTSWLRSLARWLVPITLASSDSTASNNLIQKSMMMSSSKDLTSTPTSTTTSTVVDKISDAVNNIVDGVIHGHHERGMLTPPVTAAAF